MTRSDPVYLDHNATTPLDPRVLEAMLPYLREHFGNPSSSHAWGQRAQTAVEQARAQAAALLFACQGTVVVTGSHGGILGGRPETAIRVDALAAVYFRQQVQPF